MGGDSNPGYIDRLSRIVRNKGLKCAWYSGRPSVSDKINKMHFHYIKTGPYIRQYGPLNNPQTNQRFYKVGNDGELTDITFRFYKQSRYYENNTGNNSILIN
jgi:anaerobic ribonucleoside-triphosphate reductase activating protein